MARIAALALVFPAVFSGCVSCPPVPDMVRLPFQNLATPESALEYFRAALLLERGQGERHQYLCFSEALKEQVQERQGRAFTLENYLHVRDDVRAFVEEKAGPTALIEVGEARMLSESPHLAEVTLRGHGQTATVQMIQETEFVIYWREASLGYTLGRLPFGHAPPAQENQRILVELPLKDPPPGITGEDVYRVTYERAWKILGIKDTDLAADLQRFLEAREKEGASP